MAQSLLLGFYHNQAMGAVHMRKKKLVMVGNGMAGVRTLEELLKIAPEQYEITVFGAEPHPNYNRILLSPVLAGEMTIQDIILNDHSWYAQHGITLHLGKKVGTIDRVRRRVIADDGTEATYDRLLLSTGSSPFILPVPGNDLPGVISYRDISDTDAMIDAARRYGHAVVIGGGLLGLEAANGLKLRGMDVTVVHLADWLLERQLDQTAGRMLQKSLEDRGPEVPARQTDRNADRRRERAGGGDPPQGRSADPGRPGGDGRRHPAEHGAGRRRRVSTKTARRFTDACWPSCRTPATRGPNASPALKRTSMKCFRYEGLENRNG
jgi:hypothetical protein